MAVDTPDSNANGNGHETVTNSLQLLLDSMQQQLCKKTCTPIADVTLDTLVR